MRIAFFTDTYPPTHDGVAQATETLARALTGQGHSVVVFTVRRPGTSRREGRPGEIEVRRFFSVPAPSYPQYRIALFPWANLSGRRIPFDVVHVHTPGLVGLAGRWAARRARIPVVGTYHTDLLRMLQQSGRHRASRAFFRSWGRWSIDLCRGCDLATAPTESARTSLLGPGRATLRRVPRVIGNGVDTSRFRPGIQTPNWRTRWDLPDAPLVTFLGRLTRDKGVHRFLDAIERLDRERPWAALVAGEGPQRPSVVARIAAIPIPGRIRYVGPVVEPEKPRLLAQTDVYVLPSLTDTSSVALLEAMACGASCVVTPHGGPGEIARSSGTGLIVDPQDPVELSRAIDRLLVDPPLRRMQASRGRQWVAEYGSADRMASAFVDVYRTLIDESRSHPTPGSGA